MSNEPEFGDEGLGAERIDVWDAFWDQAEPEDLPDELGEIAMDRGMEVARYLAERWSGAQPYINSKKSITQEWLHERLENEFTGFNAGKLAEKYGVDRRYIHRLMRGDA